MGIFESKTHIKSDTSNTSYYEEETNREVDKNLLSQEWWKTATPEDVVAEIEKGADVNAVLCGTEQNPLSFAVFQARMIFSAAEANILPQESLNLPQISINNILTLVKYGADINAIYRSTLHLICSDYCLRILNILIENGLDVNQNISYYGDILGNDEKLINVAARLGQRKIVKRLLEAGAKDTRTFMEKIKTHIG